MTTTPTTPTTPKEVPIMEPTPTPPTPPRPINHIAQTEVYSVQANAKAEDIHIEYVDSLGRYWLRVADGIYIYIDQPGMERLRDQVNGMLS